MITLESYVCGTWQAGDGEPRLLHDPSTEEVLARCGTEGIDFSAVVQHAREVGGPSLRRLGFAGRAALLKRLATLLHEHREELIELATRNGGNTRSDAKFDIDGATATLAAYATLGSRLGDGNVLPAGDGVQLGRTPRFWGRHLRVPRAGIAVHVNAFNFPAWGMGEKMACALLAGLPVIEKPGTPTALLAWRMARIIVDSGVLPDGVFQILFGGIGDLLDHLGPQDCVAFTGSSATGKQIKSSGRLSGRNVRVNLETDSLNAAILGPDVAPGSETLELFFSHVALDMTQKAGQKCTAVRRLLVPAELAGEVVEGLAERLAGVKVGDPSDPNTRMGPLATAQQLFDVRAGMSSLAEVARLVCGGPEPIAEKGYFVPPTLFVAENAGSEIFHTEEVFGPVATLLPYAGHSDQAIEIANLGGGSLVASIYSDDAEWTKRVLLGIAPWHGRVWIGGKKVAGQASPPGTVLPQSVHGGPGRAGGGEELGGLRGLDFYTQRLAVQGFKGFVAGACEGLTTAPDE